MPHATNGLDVIAALFRAHGARIEDHPGGNVGKGPPGAAKRRGSSRATHPEPPKGEHANDFGGQLTPPVEDNWNDRTPLGRYTMCLGVSHEATILSRTATFHGIYWRKYIHPSWGTSYTHHYHGGRSTRGLSMKRGSEMRAKARPVASHAHIGAEEHGQRYYPAPLLRNSCRPKNGEKMIGRWVHLARALGLFEMARHGAWGQRRNG